MRKSCLLVSDMATMRERVLAALNSKDKVALQVLYDEMFLKLSSSALCAKDDLLMRIGKGINRNINAENFIPDYAKRKESPLTAIR